MGLYLLDYGAGNVQSLANTLTKLGHHFRWISSPADFKKATVSPRTIPRHYTSRILANASV